MWTLAYRPSYNLRTMYVGQLFPEAVRVKLPIAMHFEPTLDTAGGGGGAWYQKGWGLNNLFKWDPDLTAHQPRGFNEWAAFYQICGVVSQNVRLGVLPNSADSVPLFAILYQSFLGTAEISGTSQLYDNMERARDPQLNAKWLRIGTNAGEGKWQWLQQKFYTRANVTDSDISSFEFRCDGTLPPDIEREFHIFLRTEGTGTLTETVFVNMTSTVDCIFRNPRNMPGS